jgi:uracil-DNA glycosylase
MNAANYFGGWYKFINVEFLATALHKISQIKADFICPNTHDIFRAFRVCPYEDCKVVMIGPEPYIKKGMATGIPFGTWADVGEANIPTALANLKEACINYGVPHNKIDFDNTLEDWASQGILMLNASLTCYAGYARSHTNIWRRFISSFLAQLSHRETGIIYVLFGAEVKTLLPYIESRGNYIIQAPNPYYCGGKDSALIKVFPEINEILHKLYDTEIEWYHES